MEVRDDLEPSFTVDSCDSVDGANITVKGWGGRPARPSSTTEQSSRDCSFD